MRLPGATLRWTTALLVPGGNHASTSAAANPATIFQAAERLCVAQGGTFVLSLDGETCTCLAPDNATFRRRDLLDGRDLCESTGGEWTDVFGLWYTCELPG